MVLVLCVCAFFPLLQFSAFVFLIAPQNRKNIAIELCAVCACVLEQSVFNADKENPNHPEEPMTEIAEVQVHKLATF